MIAFKKSLRVSGGALLILGSSLLGTKLALAAECAKKTVAECADALASKVDQLEQENAILNKSLVADEGAIKALTQDATNAKKSLADITTQLQSVGPDVYQCPMFKDHPQGSLGGGSWGYYGCQGQISTQDSCAVIEWPNRKDYSCTKVGKLRYAQ